MTLVEAPAIALPADGPRRKAIRLPQRLAFRFRARTLVPVLVLMSMTFGISAYFEQVTEQQPAAVYPISAPAESWLQAPTPAVVTWYRAELDISTVVRSGVLSVDARDTYRVWINGRVAVTNRTEARRGDVPVADVVDVRSLLRVGRNVVAIQVSALGEDEAALWARLQLDTNGSPVDLGTDSPLWKVTTEAGLTDTRLGMQPGFTSADFVDTAWESPAQIAPVRAISSAVPDALFKMTSLTAMSVRGFDAVYTVTATMPSTLEDSWLQVAATGAVAIAINGQLIADEPAPGYQSPNSRRTAPLHLFHVGNQLHSGANDIALHVTAEQKTAVAIGVLIDSAASGWEPTPATDLAWAISAAGATMTPTPLSLQAMTSTWPNGFTVSAAPADPGQVGWLGIGTTAVIAWLLVMIVILGTVVALRPRVAAGVVVGRIVLILGPASAAILAALAYGRWITLNPGFAYSEVVAAVIVLVVTVPVLAVGIMTAIELWGPLRSERRSATPANPPAKTHTHRRFRLRALPPRLNGSRVAIIAVAVLSGAVQSWRLGRQPLWQDEVTSMVVARTMQHNGLPLLDSGLFYFKAELYHALLAVVMSVSDNPTLLRFMSVLWFVATVLVFGLVLMPTLTSRRELHVIATVLLVFVPAELAWARDIRMYQQMQFFAVLFIALFIRALRNGRTRDIVGSAVTLLAMYLSHEESFVMLPALPLMMLMARQLVWARRRTFLTAFLPVGAVVAIQYVVSHIHPPDFGEDLSNRPYVGWDPNQVEFYYQKIFFGPVAEAGSLTVLSSLAVIGAIVGFRRRDRSQKLVATALVVTVLGMSLILTAKVDRYSFVTIPLLVALAVFGGDNVVRTMDSLRRRVVLKSSPRRLALTIRLALIATIVLAVLGSLATLVVSPRGFGLLAADVAASPNPLTHTDYAPPLEYLKAHQLPGDQVVTLAPPVMANQYLGRAPDRVIQTGRNKLLYLVLRDGQAVETILGVPVLLTGDQLRTYLEAHNRVWLLSDTGSYLQGVPPDVQTVVENDFVVVAQDGVATVSLWDAG